MKLILYFLLIEFSIDIINLYFKNQEILLVILFVLEKFSNFEHEASNKKILFFSVYHCI